MASFFITTGGWFAWNGLLDAVFEKIPSGVYNIRDSFTSLWGDDPIWWSTVFINLGMLGLFELLGKAAKRKLIVTGWWMLPKWASRDSGRAGRGGVGKGSSPEEWDLTVWQEMEQDPLMMARLKRMARGENQDDLDDDDLDVEVTAPSGWWSGLVLRYRSG